MSAAIILGVAMVTVVYVAAIMVCFLYIRRCVFLYTRDTVIRFGKQTFSAVDCEYHYRATRMHSADYAVERCLCPSMCPSIRLSVCNTPVYGRNGLTHRKSVSTVR